MRLSVERKLREMNIQASEMVTQRIRKLLKESTSINIIYSTKHQPYCFRATRVTFVETLHPMTPFISRSSMYNAMLTVKYFLLERLDFSLLLNNRNILAVCDIKGDP